ncbi:hypothetical protein D3C76_792720 [compost metagenome]
MTASLRASCSEPSSTFVVLARRLSRIRLRKLGALMEARIAMIAITTINSISENPADFRGEGIGAFLTLWIAEMLPAPEGNFLSLWMTVTVRAMSGRRPFLPVNQVA